jgi:hypothetical protein
MHAQYAAQQAPPPGYGEHGGAWNNAPSEALARITKTTAHRTSTIEMSTATRMSRKGFATTTGKASSVATTMASVT